MAKHNKQTIEVIAKLPSNRQDAASEGEKRRRGVATTLSVSEEAIAPRREDGWDESFAIASIFFMGHHITPMKHGVYRRRSSHRLCFVRHVDGGEDAAATFTC